MQLKTVPDVLRELAFWKQRFEKLEKENKKLRDLIEEAVLDEFLNSQGSNPRDSG